MLLLHASIASACILDTVYEDDELVLPSPGGTTTSDAWIVVDLRRAGPSDLSVVDAQGIEVPVDAVPLGPSSPRATTYALIPRTPLVPGNYALRGMREVDWFSSSTTAVDLPFAVRDGESDPVAPPTPLERTLAADIAPEPRQTSCFVPGEYDRIQYGVCGDHVVTVATIGEDRPPDHALDADLDLVSSWGDLFFDEGEVAAGDVITVWIGAMDARGDIAWAEPDTFEMPEDDWVVTTRSVEAADGTCPDWEGWGASSRRCGGPDCKETEAKGCATAPVPGWAALALAPLALRRRKW